MYIFDFLIFIVGHTVARVVLPLVSFRKIMVQPITSLERNYNAIGYRYLGKGRIELEDTLSGFIGCVILLAVIFSCSLLIGLA
jgi:hypothetical protein